MPNDQEQREILLKKVKALRESAESFLRVSEPEGARLTNRTILLGGVASLLGALQLAFGHARLDLAKAIRPDAELSVWQVLAAAAAICAGLASIYGQKYKSREIASRVAKVQASKAKLEGLQTLLELGLVTVREAGSRYDSYVREIPFVPTDGPHPTLRGQASLDAVKGQIISPSTGQSVPRTCEISGIASGLGSNVHLWLAVEVRDLVWPKEGQILPENDGSWTATVFEDGATDQFSMSLLAANRRANKKILAWLAAGKRTRNYRQLTHLAGTRRVARVEGLRLASR